MQAAKIQDTAAVRHVHMHVSHIFKRASFKVGRRALASLEFTATTAAAAVAAALLACSHTAAANTPSAILSLRKHSQEPLYLSHLHRLETSRITPGPLKKAEHHHVCLMVPPMPCCIASIDSRTHPCIISPKKMHCSCRYQ